MSNEFKNVIPGKIYRHYKGGIYKVLHLAKNTDNDEDMVIYQSTQFGSYHARPLTNWNTPVNNKPRFYECN
jgi:hypothetical protein